MKIPCNPILSKVYSIFYLYVSTLWPVVEVKFTYSLIIQRVTYFYLDPAAPCALSCRPAGPRGAADGARGGVPDGTDCSADGELRVCLAGECTAVGCNFQLGPAAARVSHIKQHTTRVWECYYLYAVDLLCNKNFLMLTFINA